MDETFSTNRFYQGAWVVYFNGVEIPIVEATVSFGVWEIPTASISIVPDVSMERLGYEDRVQVTIFYLDEFRYPNAPQFRLMGEFEIVGWSYTNTGVSRFIQYDCVGQLQILQQLQMVYLSSVSDIASAFGPVGATDPNNFVTPKVLYPQSLFLRGLSEYVDDTPPAEGEPVGPVVDDSAIVDDTMVETTATVFTPKNEFITRPIDYLINLFVALAGTVTDKQGNTPSKVAANLMLNDTNIPGKVPLDCTSVPARNFFRRWMEMTDFLRRWVAFPVLEDAGTDACYPLLKAVQNYEVVQAALSDTVGQSAGEAGSALQVLKMVLDVMLMEVVTIPAPAAVMVDETNWVIKEKFTTNRNKGTLQGHLAQHCIKPLTIFGLPPRCNIIFPSMIESFNFQESYINQPTRVYLGERFLAQFLGSEDSVDKTMSQLLATGFPLEVQARMRQYASNPTGSTKNFLLFSEEFYKGPVSKHVVAPPWLWLLQKLYESKKEAAQAVEYAAPVLDDSFVEKPDDYFAGVNNTTPNETIATVTAVPGGTTVNEVTGTDKAYLITLPDGSIKDIRDDDFSVWAGCKIYAASLKAAQDLLGVTSNNSEEVLMGACYFYSGNWGPISKYFKANNSKFPDAFDTNDKKYGTTKEYYHTYKRSYRNFKAYYSDVDLYGYDASAWPGHRTQKVEGGGTVFTDLVKKEDFDRVLPYLEKYCPVFGVDIKAMIAIIRKESRFHNQKAIPDAHYTEKAFVRKSDGKKVIAVGVCQVMNSVAINLAREWSLQKGGAVIDFDGMGPLFDLYAAYEYYRSRYVERNGVVNMAFDPYVVPGFTAVVFDQQHPPGQSVIGYVNRVIHHFSAQGAKVSTTVHLGFIRTLQEYKGDQADVFEGGNQDNLTGQEAVTNASPFIGMDDAYPPEPIPDVRSNFQSKSNAEKIYSKLFYADRDKEQAVALSLEDLVTIVGLNGKEIEGDTSAEPVRLIPTAKTAACFDNYSMAMQYVSRPVCTLPQYLDLIHRPKNRENQIGAKEDSFSSKLRSDSATYHRFINNYPQGPGEIDPAQYGNVTGPASGYAPPASWSVLPVDKYTQPQTRKDWRTILIRYRNMVLSRKGQTGVEE